MTLDELERIRDVKYNNWGQRKPLICANAESQEQALAAARNSKLSPSVQSAIYVHKLTGCCGFEFVAFSNAKIDRAVRLPYNVVLYPCFLPEIGGTQKGDRLAEATIRMQQAARYVYDGWMPIEKFDDVTVVEKLRHINEALAVFFLVNQSYFEWEPKYYLGSPARPVHHTDPTVLEAIEAFSLAADSRLNEDDRAAIFRSIAWLAEAGKAEDVKAKFLFFFVAVESLVKHIEENAKDDSPLSVMRVTKREPTKSKKEKKRGREKCIDEMMERLADDRTEAVRQAYFTCIQPSINSMIKNHIETLMGKDDSDVLMFFRKTDSGDSLSRLRNKIVHGGLDALDEQDVMQIENTVCDAERFALRYVWAVLQKSLDFYNQSHTMPTSISHDFFHSVIVGSNIAYQGSIDMVTIYTFHA